MHRTVPHTLQQSDWCFIGGVKEKDKSFEETIFRDVEREANIKLAKVELLSELIYKNRRKHFYHAKLSDENVNDIKREDGQTLDFFTPQELEKLPLTSSTRLFLIKHKTLLETVPSN